jgi:hypothetical protein
MRIPALRGRAIEAVETILLLSSVSWRGNGSWKGVFRGSLRTAILDSKLLLNRRRSRYDVAILAVLDCRALIITYPVEECCDLRALPV